MSARMFPEDTLFFQRLMQTDGLYDGGLDGIWGPKTERGARKFEQHGETLQRRIGSFDHHTEHHIWTLSLTAQREARLFMKRVTDSGLRIRIVSGTRSPSQQNRLYRQGRFGNPGPIVTRVRGGYSRHNFGIAWDIGIFTESGGYETDEKLYRQVAAAGADPNIEWGGSWSSMTDLAHFQLRTNLSIADLRYRFEHGQPIPVDSPGLMIA